MTEFLLSIFYFLIFCVLIGRLNFFNDTHISRKWFYYLFGLKVIVSVGLTAIYTNYYTNRETADIFKYFDDSKIMFDAVKNNPLDYFKMLFAIDNDNAYFNNNYYSKMLHWVRPYSADLFSDSHIIIRFNAFVRLFSFGHFQVHNIFINFISLIGLTLLYKSIKSFVKEKEKLLFIIVSLIPSLLFWGSGLLKEGIIILALGLTLYGLTSGLTIKTILIIILGGLLLLYTKFYLLVALFIPVVGYLSSSYLKLKPAIGYTIAFILFIVVVIISPLINSDWDIVFQIANKQQTFSRFITEVETNSGFIIPELSNGISIIKNIPNALLNTLIRPYPWESKSLFVLLSFFENLILLGALVFTLFNRVRINREQQNIFGFLITFSITLYILIGLTTPVFGAIVRYKLPGLLFIFILLTLILDIEKVKSKHKLLNKIL